MNFILSSELFFFGLSRVLLNNSRTRKKDEEKFFLGWREGEFRCEGNP